MVLFKNLIELAITKYMWPEHVIKLLVDVCYLLTTRDLLLCVGVCGTVTKPVMGANPIIHVETSYEKYSESSNNDLARSSDEFLLSKYGYSNLQFK